MARKQGVVHVYNRRFQKLPRCLSWRFIYRYGHVDIDDGLQIAIACIVTRKGE